MYLYPNPASELMQWYMYASIYVHVQAAKKENTCITEREKRKENKDFEPILFSFVIFLRCYSVMQINSWIFMKLMET